MKIVEFQCGLDHLTPCDVDITNRYKVEKCGECGELVSVWEHPRFRHVQPDAKARITATFVPNDLGLDDAVERKRIEVRRAHDEAEKTVIEIEI